MKENFDRVSLSISKRMYRNAGERKRRRANLFSSWQIFINFKSYVYALGTTGAKLLSSKEISFQLQYFCKIDLSQLATKNCWELLAD